MAQLPYKLNVYEHMRKRRLRDYKDRIDTDTNTEIECYLKLADYGCKYVTIREDGIITKVHSPTESKFRIGDQILEINNRSLNDMTGTDIQGMFRFNISMEEAHAGSQCSMLMVVRRDQQQFDVDVFLFLARKIEAFPESTGQTEECIFKVGPSFSNKQTKFLKCTNEEITASIVENDHDNYFLTLKKYSVEAGNQPLQVFQLWWKNFCITSSIGQISTSIRLVQASGVKENLETFFIMKRNSKGIAFESLLHKDHYITYDRSSSKIMVSFARGTGSVPLEARFHKLKKDSLPKHKKQYPDTDDRYTNNNQEDTSENTQPRHKRNATTHSTSETEPSSCDMKTESAVCLIQMFVILYEYLTKENNRNG